MTDPLAASVPSSTTEPKLLLFSQIPVARRGDTWVTMDLWARDVNVGATFVDTILCCPILGEAENVWVALADNIQVRDVSQNSSQNQVLALVNEVTMVQVPGNSGWRSSSYSRKLVRAAHTARRPVFMGISSNRARTNLINSRHQSLAKRGKAMLRYWDIGFSQRWLARRATGVFLVGDGLLPLIADVAENIHIGIASWIGVENIIATKRRYTPDLRICMAGRLEWMKGFHLGLEAIARLAPLPIRTTVIGAGPERERLIEQAASLGLDEMTLLEPVAYPEPFFRILDDNDLVLLTNLNDEQPRLIFDAASRGCIPVCPRSEAYLRLGLDPRTLYRAGDIDSLSACIRRLADAEVRADIASALPSLAHRFTIQSMHSRRLEWMLGSV